MTPDAVDVEVGFARTLTCAGEPPVREIATLTLQMIATAARRIYAENQYLTSAAVVRALGERLGSAEGPEVVLVLPATESGWMEQGSMGLLRQEALAHLRRQDTRARLRLVSPVVSAGAESRAVAVHAKVLVVDEHILKVGSANFSNRSLGLDSECDLVVDVREQAGVAFVARVRDRLLGEHLGLEASEVGRRRRGRRVAVRCSSTASRPARHDPSCPSRSCLRAAFDFTVLDGAMVDPAEPWSVDGLLERAVPVPLRRRLTRRWLRPLLFAAAVIGAWAILRRGPLRSVHFGAMVLDVAGWLGAQRAGAFLAFAGVALASFLFVPITLLATATLTVFGVWPGVPIAWTGAVLGATSVARGRRAMGATRDRLDSGPPGSRPAPVSRTARVLVGGPDAPVAGGKLRGAQRAGGRLQDSAALVHPRQRGGPVARHARPGRAREPRARGVAPPQPRRTWGPWPRWRPR